PDELDLEGDIDVFGDAHGTRRIDPKVQAVDDGVRIEAATLNLPPVNGFAVVVTGERDLAGDAVKRQLAGEAQLIAMRFEFRAAKGDGRELFGVEKVFGAQRLDAP